MSAEDGGGEGPYRPRRVGPPGPAYSPPPQSWWRREKPSKPPKPPKPAKRRKRKKEDAPSEQAPPPAEQAPPVEEAPPPPVQSPPPATSQPPPAPSQPPPVPQPQAPPAQQPQPAPPEQAPAQPPPVDESQPSPGDEPEKPRKRRGRKVDYLVGIPLGLLLGIGIVTAFLFLGSEKTIDAPRIDNGGSTGAGGAAATGSVPFSGPSGAPGQTGSGGPSGQAGAGAPSAPVAPPPPAELPVVRIEGSNPPLEAGAVTIAARKGVAVRFRVSSDGPVSIEIVGTGFTRDVSDGDVVTFTPNRVGQFPTFVSGNDVNVATFDVSP